MAYYKLIFIKKYRLLLLTIFFFLVSNIVFYLSMPEFKKILFDMVSLNQEAIKNHKFFLVVFTLSSLISSFGLGLFFNVLFIEDENPTQAKKKILQEEKESENSIKKYNVPITNEKKEPETVTEASPKQAPKRKLIQH